MAGDLVHALAELGVVPVARHELRLDALVGGLPGARRRRRCGRPHRSRWPRSPTAGRSGAGGSCGTPARRSPRPTRCGAGGPTGRARARRSRRGRSSGRSRPARCRRRPRPARRPATSCQTRASVASVSSGNRMAPLGVSCQDSPRSSERHTCGPSQDDDEPTRMRGRSPLRLDHGGVDLLHLEVRTGPRPVRPGVVGLPDPQSLARADQQNRAHACSSSSTSGDPCSKPRPPHPRQLISIRSRISTETAL